MMSKTESLENLNHSIQNTTKAFRDFARVAGEKPKPCPFCGEIPRLTIARNFGNTTMPIRFSVRCANLKCDIFPWTQGYEKKEDAIKVWNTRPNYVFDKDTGEVFLGE